METLMTATGLVAMLLAAKNASQALVVRLLVRP